MNFSEDAIQTEATRLHKNLQSVGWTLDDCKIYAPLTLEINTLKKEKDALILSHSYQTPDIMYGVADVVGDSYTLSKIAHEHPAKVIIFASVYFMGETAKLLNPDKEVRVPDRAGCSLADSITAADVRALKKEHPGAGVVCYVNTSAAVKAECDVCCTSANALRVINNMPQDTIIFIPDELMAQNLQPKTNKKLISWPGRCIVHERFSKEKIKALREDHPNVHVLAHLECKPEVVENADMAGSTSDIVKYIKDNSDSDPFMIITECGITDRIRTELPNKKIVGTCSMCPYMKQITMRDILKSLKNPTADQIVEIPEDIAKKARATITNMWQVESNKPSH